MPSQFNVQTTTEDGWLILWNSSTGSMNTFPPDQRDKLVALLSRKGFDAPRGGIVAYLADRGFLVPRSTNEVRRVQYAFGKEQHRSDVLELILLASEDCNFRCKYCYEGFRRGTMRRDVRAGIKRFVEDRIEGGLKAFSVAWFGGEPLYGMNAIDDLAPFFAQKVADHDLEFYSHMTTNGYLLTDDIAGRLLRWGVNDFQVTLDGLAEDHDKHRPTRDGEGTFDVILDNLTRLSKRREDFVVAVRVNFDQENLPGLERFLDIVKKSFKDDRRFIVSFHAVGKWGGENDAELKTCGIGEVKDIQLKLKAAARERGIALAGGAGPNASMGTEVCYAARPYNFIIGASGAIMKCTIDLDEADHNIVGHIHPDGRMELDDDKMALWTEPAFERDTGCQSCHMLAACQGVHCPKIRIDQGKAPCTPLRTDAKQRLLEHFESRRAKDPALYERHAAAGATTVPSRRLMTPGGAS